MARDLEKRFAVTYAIEDGNVTEHRSWSQEANDTFADGLTFVGAKEIIKSYWDPLLRKWLPYTDRIFYAETV